MDYECTANEVNVFETGLAAPGCSEVSQAATTPCRRQLWPMSRGRTSKLSGHCYACLCTIPPHSDLCDHNVVLYVAEQPRYDTAYACEGKTLKLECRDGELIHLIRANYGRFSITICNDHGNTDWSVNCMSTRSLRVLFGRYCVWDPRVCWKHEFATLWVRYDCDIWR